MEKKKLIEIRIRKGFTQKQVAEHLCMDPSNYNRREKGFVKINNQEWGKLSLLFDIPIEVIYESNEGIIELPKTNEKLNNSSSNPDLITIPKHLLDHQKRYIDLLEEENQLLRSLIDQSCEI
ncbi:helix-turn-helix transcriptional regulator [Flavobacterium sp. SUN046]|uniref:helix-turn-helix transcriptional regulator n=1 Tax=Flavobacterium sp. SUN046 TaxID=3002440 RepID=UPI002DBEF677|nr:helix-turn-helix transcriptional regulator [Flavobacterium sp. SUN046]MEC4047855.1 helix-turn-helix transcriptional regulator [Flavobacterium sp. SUN046]